MLGCAAMRKLVPLLLVFCAPLLAKEREGVVAPPQIEVAGKPLQLLGMGLRKKLFFKVYLASLYVEAPADDAAQIVSSEQIKRVQMNMLRDLERGKIVEAVQQGFERNSAAAMPGLQARLDQFLAAIPDLKEGQTIVITYLPGRGTLLKAGAGEEISVPGKDFADALFSVWLGRSPVDDELKNEMMKNR